MKREIKFRMWLEGGKVFHYTDSLYCQQDDMKLYYLWCFKVERIEQYTGLKDKNGKEIYEGDILEYEGDRSEVVWRDKNCDFYCDALPLATYECSCADWTKAAFAEIIGNIHENPELLEGEK